MADDAVYVRATGRGIATRPSSLRPGHPPTYIGASRDLGDPRKVIYSAEIYRISLEEWTAYRREYERAIAEASLERVDPVLWLAQEKRRKQDEEQQRKSIDEAAQKAAIEEQKLEAARKKAMEAEVIAAKRFLESSDRTETKDEEAKAQKFEAERKELAEASAKKPPAKETGK